MSGPEGGFVSDVADPGVRLNSDEYVLDSGTRLILLAEGRVVNLIAAEGNPAAVMDLTFAAQALALVWLISGQADTGAPRNAGVLGNAGGPGEADAAVRSGPASHRVSIRCPPRSTPRSPG
jgi:hypothetical protein